MDTFYITTPIYYVNANPHLGHAYTSIVADSAVRMHKMLGYKTLFLSGTDEHGDKIVQAAEKMGLTPEQFTAEISANFRKLWPDLSVDLDFFERTTDPRHEKKVQDFLHRLYEAGDIYYGEFGGYYCYGCERFYTEKELVDGCCPQHLTAPQFISEKNYFFRMSRYLPWLKEYLESNPDLIRPERYRNEALAMLEEGVLEDLCISRPKSRLVWGIELPFDKNYVCYVWFDALLTYLTGIGWPNSKDSHEFWPGEHLIAKDILKPHAIFWPCMLKAADIPIYRHLNVHGYWLSRDTKMSKSLGNVVDPLTAISSYGLDAFRYFLLREMRFGSDASFSDEAVIARINADLANDLGNLFSRVLSMNSKYFDGMTPKYSENISIDASIAESCRETMENYITLFMQWRFSQALETLWLFIRSLNKFVDTSAPWNLYKLNQLEQLSSVLNNLLAALRKIALCLWPVMPAASIKMLTQLGQSLPASGKPPCCDLRSEINTFEFLPQGLHLARESGLFPRLETAKKEDIAPAKTQKQKLSRPKSEIDFETFQKLDLAIGEVIKAEKHPDADRLLRIEADFGEERPRQIISGLADHYNPQELIGKKVCAILNLAPRKIRGLISEGMILTAEDGDKLELLTVGDSLANGSRIK